MYYAKTNNNYKSQISVPKQKIEINQENFYYLEWFNKFNLIAWNLAKTRNFKIDGNWLPAIMAKCLFETIGSNIIIIIYLLEFQDRSDVFQIKVIDNQTPMKGNWDILRNHYNRKDNHIEY